MIKAVDNERSSYKNKDRPHLGSILGPFIFAKYKLKKAKKCVNHREIVGWDYLFDNLKITYICATIIVLKI